MDHDSEYQSKSLALLWGIWTISICVSVGFVTLLSGNLDVQGSTVPYREGEDSAYAGSGRMVEITKTLDVENSGRGIRVQGHNPPGQWCKIDLLDPSGYNFHSINIQTTGKFDLTEWSVGSVDYWRVLWFEE